MANLPPFFAGAAAATVTLVSLSAAAQGYAPPPSQAPPPGESNQSYRSDDDGGGSGGATDLMPPSTRPMFFVGAIGPDFFGISHKAFKPKDFTRFHLAFDFGYHFSGDGEGPAIGATLEQTFGKGFYTLNPGFKFWWDIHITDMAIYVAPFGKAGYVLGVDGQSAHAFNLAVGAEGRVVFKDRWMALFRPIQIDTFMGDFFGETFTVNYTIMLGGGLTF